MKESLVSPSLAKFNAGTNEEWADIPGTSGIYQVSNYGRIRSFTNRGSHNPGDLVKLKKDKKGYMQIEIVINGKRVVKKVHRLVAQAFVPNSLNLLEINHKDEVKSNNRADNLEWCNHVYNIRYGTGKERGLAKLRKKICQFDFGGNLVKIWPSVKEAGRSLCIDSACIVRCANGEAKTFHKSIWLYLEDENKSDTLRGIISWLKCGNNKDYAKTVKIGSYSDSGELVKTFDSIRGAEKVGFKSAGICRSIKKGQKHFGYYWKHITV